MTDDLSPHQDELDELLSADIDGELDAAARDLGITGTDARARVRDADDRRRALTAARDQLAEAPELDELVAARLRAKAVRAAETEHRARTDEHTRRRRVLAGVGAAAAAVVAVAAVAAGLHAISSSQSGGAKSSAGAVLAPRAAPRTPTAPRAGAAAQAALGSYNDAHALGLAAVQRATLSFGSNSATPPNNPAQNNTAPEAAETPSTVVPGAGAVTSSGGEGNAVFGGASGAASSVPAPPKQSASPKTNLAELQQLQSCTARPTGTSGDTLELRATATLAGAPVLVLVYAGGGEHVVVVEDLHCKLLNLQTLG